MLHQITTLKRVSWCKIDFERANNNNKKPHPAQRLNAEVKSLKLFLLLFLLFFFLFFFFYRERFCHGFECSMAEAKQRLGQNTIMNRTAQNENPEHSVMVLLFLVHSFNYSSQNINRQKYKPVRFTI